MAKVLGFGYGSIGRGPYMRTAGLSGSELDPKALATPYDLNVPGRVAEIKRALATVGQADQGQETLWRVLSTDDAWDDAAEGEYAVFVSRWRSRLGCYPAPFIWFSMGTLQPTFTGLLMLDAAYRSVGSGGLSSIAHLFQGCDTGAASNGMPALETFLTGTPPPAQSALLLLRKGAEKVQVAGAGATHPVPPPDADPTLYAQYQNVDAAMQGVWVSLIQAPTEAARLAALQSIDTTRRGRDQIAQQIIAKAGGRTGTTQIENVGRCDAGTVWSADTKTCVAPAAPPPAQSSFNAGGAALLAAGVGLVVWAVRGKPERARAHR